MQTAFGDEEVELLVRQRIGFFFAHGKARAGRREPRYAILVALAPGEEAGEGGQVVVGSRWCTVLYQPRTELVDCSGLLTPDTHLGENARHREVSDDQATPYLYP